MPTLLLTHPSCVDHEMGSNHPERPDRIRAIDRELSDEQFSGLIREKAPLGKEEDILRAHPKSHYDAIKSTIPKWEKVRLDEDTLLCPKSWEPILYAVGAGVAAVDKVMSGAVNNAFCALRPPGHHAEKATAMGFCFFNNVAIASYYAMAKYGIKRVAVIDFDVHHGNGTQDIFWDEPDMFYGSTHEMPLYPGSGAVSETGAGNIFNAPLSTGSGSETFREALELGVLQPLEAFEPEFVFISAGFDAHHLDRLSTINLTEDDFAWVTLKIMELAEKSAAGRIVSMLEGGYNLEGLSKSVAVHVSALMQA